MKELVFKFLRFLFMPVLIILYKKRLPHFSQDFGGKRVFMISELSGGENQWAGLFIGSDAET